jgi:hypothetical protein
MGDAANIGVRSVDGGFVSRPALIAPALLALAALAAGVAPVAAQTGPNTTGASAISPRPAAPAAQPERPVSPAYANIASFTRGFLQVQTQYTGNLISDTFAAALQRSRDTVRPNSKPIPEEVKRELIPFYPASLLENVQYTIGDTSQAGLAGFAIRNGNAAAVTLIDTIVFKDEKYVGSLALWAHEIHHVQQYKDWGLGGFAARYAFSWSEVEAEAGARASAFVAWYRERKGQ